jgi:tetratricopeptide (TPR) repeat protein
VAISPLEQLQNELTKPNQVIALVGAGVTIGSLKPDSNQAKIASWKSLLLDAVEQVEKNNLLPSPEMAATLRQNINSGDLTLALAAAQSMQKHLGVSGFQRWLNNSVGTFKNALRDPPEVIQALSALQIPIITLNYDDTITHVTHRKPFTWKDDDAVGKVLRGNLENVLHLHGYYERADTVVFSLEDYAEIIRHPHTQAVLQALQSTKTLLFIGCGDTFSDPNFSRLLEWAKPIFKKSSHTHFLLELKGNVVSRQEGFKPEDHILVVSYGKAHDDLAEFLRSLAPTSTPKVPLTTSSATVPSGTWVNLTQPDVRIGGDDKLKALVKAMLEPENPVLVMGLAGIGKSNLCEHALQNPEVVKLFGSRRAFIRCDAVTDCINLVAQIATATNVPLGDYLEARVLSELEQSPAVMVLDNLETPWMKDTNAVEDLLRILAAVPGLVLVGGVRGSTRPKGATWTTIQPEVMSHKDARALFLEFSEAKFANDPLLDGLLEKLDGLPLAIKLLAFQAQGDPNLNGLVQRYDTKRTALLSKGADKASNLAISLELSFEQPRMNPLAQAAASVMALLPDGIKHSDIASVLEDGEEAAHILRNVGLVFDRDERLRMLAPVREHFHEAHPIDGTALVQAVEFYAGLAEELGKKIGTEDGAEVIKRLTPEFGNLCKMIILATNTNSDSAFNAAYSIGRFSSFTELDAVEVLIFVLEKTNFDQDKTHLIAILGDIAFSRSDYNKARELYEQVLYLCEKFGDTSAEAYCTLQLGSIALEKSGSVHILTDKLHP